MKTDGTVAKHVRILLPERLSLSVLIPAALVLWFSVPTLASLNVIWLTDADYSHGYLVLIMVAFLAVRESRAISASPVPSWVGAACLLLTTPFVIIGHASSTVLIAQVALPALWMAAVFAFAGAPFAHRVLPSLSYLYFAIPVWNVLIEPMRTLTIMVVSAWIRVAGLPAFIEGNFVHVPSGTFEVEGGCAGLRYALVAAALAAFRGLLDRRGWRQSALLTIAAIALALVGNWVRVFTTVAAGLNPEWLILQMVRDYHTLFGWILFIVFMIPLLYLDRALQPGNDAAPGPAAVTVRRPVALPTAVTWVGCLGLAFVIWISHRIDGAEPLSPTALVFSPPAVAGWDAPIEWRDGRTPLFVGASAWTAGWYVKGNSRVGAYVAHYPSQRQEHEVVFALNRPEGQAPVAEAGKMVAVAMANGLAVPFGEIEAQDFNGERRLVWVGFRVAGKPVARSLLAKAFQVEGAIRGRRDAQVLVLTARCAADCTEARSSISNFAMVAAGAFYDVAERSLTAP